jgi:hypothetical protein
MPGTCIGRWVSARKQAGEERKESLLYGSNPVFDIKQELFRQSTGKRALPLKHFLSWCNGIYIRWEAAQTCPCGHRLGTAENGGQAGTTTCSYLELPNSQAFRGGNSALGVRLLLGTGNRKTNLPKQTELTFLLNSGAGGLSW